MKLTKDQILRLLTTIAAIIGVITAIASLSTMNVTIALVAAVIILVSTIAIVISYLIRRDNKTAKDVRGFEGLKILSIRTVMNEAELKTVAELDEDCYGEHSVDFQGLTEWWKRYPKGAYAIFLNGKLIGAIGMWPLTKSAFIRLTSGRLAENQFIKSDISAGRREQAYWYFGDIILDKKYRTKKLSQYLPPDQLMKRNRKDESLGSYFLHRTLEKWVEEAKLPPHVTICAIGASPTGINLLDRFGFHKLPNQTPDKLPIYILESSLQDIRHGMEAIWGFTAPQSIQNP